MAYDVVVVGLGAYGSAIAYHLARAGAKVLGLDRHAHAAHPWGSSHGHTRIIRLAYKEGAAYVPLLQRSYQRFLDLQEACGQPLFKKTGHLDLGACAVDGDSIASVEKHGLAHEVLTGKEVNKRFPGYGLPDDMPALYQPDGGLLNPEACVQAHCDGAEQAGAHLRWGQQVVDWKASGRGTSVHLSDGTVVNSKSLVLSAGPWMADLLPAAKALMVPQRQVVGWFKIQEEHQRTAFRPESFPVFMMDTTPSAGAGAPGLPDSMPLGGWYGFPDVGSQRGFKIGKYQHLNEVCHPDSIDRKLHDSGADEEALRSAVRAFFPLADGPMLAWSTCMFTNTPDGHFIVDWHPSHPQRVMVCSACSGHGFKMSTGIGELISREMLKPEGDAEATAELLLHRIHADREGHAAWLAAR